MDFNFLACVEMILSQHTDFYTFLVAILFSLRLNLSLLKDNCLVWMYPVFGTIMIWKIHDRFFELEAFLKAWTWQCREHCGSSAILLRLKYLYLCFIISLIIFYLWFIRIFTVMLLATTSDKLLNRYYSTNTNILSQAT